MTNLVQKIAAWFLAGAMTASGAAATGCRFFPVPVSKKEISDIAQAEKALGELVDELESTDPMYYEPENVM